MINSIKLNNFKCFKEQTFHFKNLNLLSGVNGLGKSTVIQSLLLLRQNYDNGILNEKPIQANIPDAILNGELVQFGSASDVLYQYAKDDKIYIEIEFGKKEKIEWSLGIDDKTGDFLKSYSLNYKSHIPISNRVLFSKNFHYLSAERIGPREIYPISSYQVNNKNQLGIRGEYVPYYLFINGNRNISLKELKHSETEGNTLLEQVNSWLQEIRPYTQLKPIGDSSMNSAGLRYSFYQEGGDIGKEFRPINVGFGLSYVLSLIVSILVSPKDTLLLIENPEAHVHPRGQAQLGFLLAKAASMGMQIICETHSDHIINAVRVAVKKKMILPDKTSFLYFSGEFENGIFHHKVVEPKVDEEGRIDVWPEGFFDETQNLLMELL